MEVEIDKDRMERNEEIKKEKRKGRKQNKRGSGVVVSCYLIVDEAREHTHTQVRQLPQLMKMF